MSEIKSKVSDLMKTFMKSGEKDRLTFARNLFNSIRKREIDDRKDIEDSEVIKIINSLIKQRQDSIEQFTKGNRADLVDKEEAELRFLQEFLPPQMSDVELRGLVEQAVTESGAASPRDIGKVMKLLLPKVQGRADGKKINQLVTEFIQKRGTT